MCKSGQNCQPATRRQEKTTLGWENLSILSRGPFMHHIIPQIVVDDEEHQPAYYKYDS